MRDGCTSTSPQTHPCWVCNAAIATAAFGGALIVSLLALAATLAAVLLVGAFLWLAVRLLRKISHRVRRSQS